MKAPATTLVERPPEGPARGAASAPVAVVVLLTVALVLLAGFTLFSAWRRSAR